VFSWRGVDKLTLREGRIIEEVVYADTAPLQALRRGETFEALIRMPDQDSRKRGANLVGNAAPSF
jgi:hypothetical protein